MHALVVDDTIQTVGGLPTAARRLDTGEWVLGLRDAPPELREATGWLPVVEVKPALGQDEDYGPPQYAVGEGEVTATYPVVPESAEVVNERNTRAQAFQALSVLQAIRDAPQAPNLATMAQATTAVRTLQANQKDIALVLQHLVRIASNRFD